MAFRKTEHAIKSNPKFNIRLMYHNTISLVVVMHAFYSKNSFSNILYATKDKQKVLEKEKLDPKCVLQNIPLNCKLWKPHIKTKQFISSKVILYQDTIRIAFPDSTSPIPLSLLCDRTLLRYSLNKTHFVKAETNKTILLSWASHHRRRRRHTF